MEQKGFVGATVIIKKAYKRMWIVRRLKSLGASTNQLLNVLNKQVLSVLFLGAPAWFGQLTTAEKIHLNRVLRCGLHTIYGDTYRSLTNALTRAGMLSVTKSDQGSDSVKKKRKKICRNLSV